jgi:predicted nucleic acid-binding protein
MFNRPFDDQSYIRVRLETEAKLYVQAQIKQGNLELVWSYMLDFENAQNPFGERQEAIKNWMSFCTIDIVETITLLEKAKHLLTFGIKPKDAIHIAAAIEANADYFLTTDDRLLGKAILVSGVKLMNPTEFVKVLDNYDN